MDTIYHIAEADDWDPDAATYEAASLASEGFIHCSTEAQLPGVATAFYAGRSDLVLLSIDARAFGSGLVYEEVEDIPQLARHRPLRSTHHEHRVPSTDGG